MSRYLANRLVEIVVTLVLMSFIVYLLIGLMPGDPIDLMRSADPRMSAEDVTRLKELYGVDRPLFARYLSWAGQVLGGELGYSRLVRISQDMKDVSTVEQTPILEGNTMTMMLAPLAEKVEKAEKPERAERPAAPQVEKKQD